MLVGHYDHQLVLVSWLVAAMASYAALDMAGRAVAATTARTACAWMIGGAFAMGFGIWSTHFIGMLAFGLPIALNYDRGIALLSMAIAIVVSAFALKQATAETPTARRLMAGALFTGVGIAATHCTGMAAMRMTPAIGYDPFLLALAFLIAVLAAGVALWIFFRLRDGCEHSVPYRLGAAAAMAFAMTGMHYTGMAAAHFPMDSVSMAATGMTRGTQWLVLPVMAITFALLAFVLLASMLTRSLTRSNRELSELALQDSLTKLPNRVLLEDRIAHAIEHAQRAAAKFALLFIDLDGFKAVNDAYGHHLGDLLLIGVADRIRKILRAQDTVARIGGDEFVLLLEKGDATNAATVAERLMYSIARPFALERCELHVSASIGIAFYPHDGQTAQALMENADAAMYHVKHAGRNGYGFFEASMNAEAQEQLQLFSDLQRALERREFVLHYQTQHRAPAGPIAGVEALLRWQHPVRGLILPDSFVPYAEKTGLLVAIGDWMIDEACRQMSEWHRAGHADWRMGVNLSAVQFSHPGLAAGVHDALERHGLPAHCLTLEVAETTIMRNADASMAILERLSGMGVGIAIDNFGTGYSNLRYLRRLPVSELKIDRGFIQALEDGNENATIVSAIIALARIMKLRSVAEGVETVDQQQLLTRLGCDVLQGYLLSRPVPAEQLPAPVE